MNKLNYQDDSPRVAWFYNNCLSKEQLLEIKDKILTQKQEYDL